MLNTKLSKNELLSRYDELLDCEGTVTICGLKFNPSRIVRELNPTVYRCGFNDWLDSEKIDLE